MSRAVFLDRDGVINRAVIRDGNPHPPSSAAELELLPGVPEALARLRQAGFLLIVVTNQPDVARGTQTKQAVEVMHRALMDQLPLDAIRACYHDGDGCNCRKPKPGLLLNAVHEFGVELHSSYMVGDRWRDIEAGQRAGCTCLFVDYGYAERQPQEPFIRVTSLLDAAAWIVANGDIAEPDHSQTGNQSP